MERIIHPDTVRRLLRNSLQQGEWNFSLLALSLNVNVDTQASLQWSGYFIGANANQIICGSYSFREHSHTTNGLHIEHEQFTNHSPDRGRTGHNGPVADIGGIKRQLDAAPLWWVIANPMGILRPCGMMARRIEHEANRIIARATN